MKPDHSASLPTILFGAFDRHNFGDLLFPHIASALLPGRRLLFAGLAARDLRDVGGHLITALPELAGQWGGERVNLLHAGGEILTCSAWEAAVMLLRDDEAQQVARLDAHPARRAQWAHARLGTSALAPYTVARILFPDARICYNAVGGVDLDAIDPAMRAEVEANLVAADAVSVRDRRTSALLAAAGIAGLLLPDPAAMAAELFGATIHDRAGKGEVAGVRRACPSGYIAVQFSVDFGDDAMLDAIASQLDRIARSTGLGIVLFRAGAAPWHDDLRCYYRTAARMRSPVQVFSSLHVWDICALIAGSRAYCGTSLHGRIVATAFALPRVTLRHPAQGSRPAKHAAYAATWETSGMPVAVDVENMAKTLESVLAADAMALQGEANAIAASYRERFERIEAAL